MHELDLARNIVELAVEAAIEWFKAHKLEGLRWERKNGESVVIKDKTAPPIWAIWRTKVAAMCR